MKVLVIPDIHEDWPTFESKVIPILRAKDFDEAVLLGDWFDTFTPHKAHLFKMVDWMLNNIENIDYNFLMGNHDLHYMFPSIVFRSSGWNPETQRYVGFRDFKEVVFPNLWGWETIDGVLYSHAGFSKSNLALIGEDEWEKAISMAYRGVCHDFFAPGLSRGGTKPFGGLVWLDWNHEFSPIEGTPQVVGHTCSKELLRKSGNSYCVDNGLTGVLWVEDGTKFEVEAL